MSTVTNPSPVKESDVLREEIIKTLSPLRSSELFMNAPRSEQPAPITENPVRESAYLDDVYGDYWGAGDSKPDNETGEHLQESNAAPPDLTTKPPVYPASEPPAVDAEVPIVPPLSPRGEPAVAAAPELRRKFSWETGPEQVSTSAEPNVAAQAATPTQETPRVTEASPAQPAQVEPEPSVAAAGPDHDHSQLTAQAGSGDLSHRVSEASSLPPKTGSEAPEAPSPVSEMTEGHAAAVADQRRLSPAEDKVLIHGPSKLAATDALPEPVTGVPERAESPPYIASPTATSEAHMRLAPFREIMDLQTITERIDKFVETRAQFASIDTGLNGWVTGMITSVPGHANATSSFDYPLSAAPLGPGLSPTQQGFPAQQPYYQQYLNASSPALQGSLSGRPTGSMGMASHHHVSSDFRHSSAQVGVKGKELLRSAGKAGKGLLSKGKNKLRGTGDKVFF
ncbi:hypothetical protein NKR23_g11304 [Pleurostoma richardsiae]|uniref:Uncharacterized protein n=1 Tax=Pleurostoma richardsiae TaxID=41990 RepID=A0AA38RHS9_9PEZI|nr:hypothetical protein NKR23_g11304 [Pleurostoma richardsiae]